MTRNSFIGLVRAVRRAGTNPPTTAARAARAARDIIGSARAIGAARRRTGRERETARRAALVDLTRVARAALGIPADIARATDTARARANWILIAHKGQIDALAAALIERRALTGRQVHELLQCWPEKK